MGKNTKKYPGFTITSTSEGRQNLHDHIMDVVGSKDIVAINRYGRILGVLVPIEAVAMLAGLPVDDYSQQRVQKHAQAFLDHLDQENSSLAEKSAATSGLGLPAGKRTRKVSRSHS